MTEPTNAVLAEQIRQLRKDLIAHKEETKEDFREVHKDIKVLEDSVNSAQKVADQVNHSMNYVTKAVDEMKSLVHGFTQLITAQNDRIDNKISEQNTKIDSFINSDKRRDSKRTLIVSILQVGAGILIAVLGFLVKG